MKTVLVILAGGEGRRMNGGKPFKMLGGQTLLSRAVEFARKQGPPVALSLRAKGQFPSEFKMPIITDRADIDGPLAGVAAGLEWASQNGFDAMLTIPVDMPWLPADLTLRLLAEFSGRPLVATSGDRAHPVCALWPVSVLDEMEGYAKRGGRSLRGILDHLGTCAVDWSVADRDPFANINDPHALVEAERLLQKSR